MYLRPLPAVAGAKDRLLTRHRADVTFIGPSAGVFRRTYTIDRAGEIRELTFPPAGPPTVEVLRRPETAPKRIGAESSGRWFFRALLNEHDQRLWSRTTWPAARPLVLRRNASWFNANTAFDPTGDWAAISTATASRLTFWPLRRPYPTVVDGYDAPSKVLAFSPDSRWLATSWRTAALSSSSAIRAAPTSSYSTAHRPPARGLLRHDAVFGGRLTQWAPGGGRVPLWLGRENAAGVEPRDRRRAEIRAAP